MQGALLLRLTARIKFSWILSPSKDLIFYIGSAVAGWIYVGVILLGLYTLDNPLTDPFATLTLGDIRLPLTLELLVVVSWALILDAPHVWATLGRTLFDPDEWQTRGRELARSFIWFFLGPVAILLPYLVGGISSQFGIVVPEANLAIGGIVFFVFFRLWAYYHVVRQHWGFFVLYRRKAGDQAPTVDKIDYWFFNLSLYLPLVIFLTSSYYLTTPGFPNIGLHAAFASGISLAAVLHPVAWVVYLAVVVSYLGFQIKLYLDGVPLNGSKLLYMAMIVPLHFVAFSHPIMAVFVVPLVTIGHNIQYHCVVYSYAQSKYKRQSDRRYRWVKPLFKNFRAYAFAGLIFTFLFYQGPWIDWLKSVTGLRLDHVMFNSLGMMAGIKDPASLRLGERIFAAFILGFAMQHYYLDSKIWRVSRDREVRKHLHIA